MEHPGKAQEPRPGRLRRERPRGRPRTRETVEYKTRRGLALAKTRRAPGERRERSAWGAGKSGQYGGKKHPGARWKGSSDETRHMGQCSSQLTKAEVGKGLAAPVERNQRSSCPRLGEAQPLSP